MGAINMIKELIQQTPFQKLKGQNWVLRTKFKEPAEEQINEVLERKVKAKEIMKNNPYSKKIEKIFRRNDFITDVEWKEVEQTVDILKENYPDMIGIIVEEWVNFPIFNLTPKDMLYFLARDKEITLFKEEYQQLYYEEVTLEEEMELVRKAKDALSDVIELIQSDEEVKEIIQNLKGNSEIVKSTLERLPSLIVECSSINHFATILVLDEIFSSLEMKEQMKFAGYLIKQEVNGQHINEIIGDSDMIFLTLSEYSNKYSKEEWYKEIYKSA
jgi:hypothetical protein